MAAMEVDGGQRRSDPKANSTPELSAGEITLVGRLGEGSFGEVWKGKCRGLNVAVKRPRSAFSPTALANFKKEVELWSKVSHPNVNMFLGACTEPGNFMIVSELLNGDLDTLYLKDAKNKWSLYQRMHFAKDAALGVLWLHSLSPQIIHRDLKLSNLLIDDNLSCKICDFGLSQFKSGESLQDRQRAKGTPLWMAPEVMMFQPFSEKADVYAFGLILWSLLTRLEPYLAYSDFPTFKHDVCEKGVRPVIPADCPPSLAALIQHCWDGIPQARPPMNAVASELDNVLIDCAVSDNVGRHFWKTYLIGKEQVTWDEFQRSVIHFWQVTPDENFGLFMRCLKSVLANQKGRDAQFFVALPRFGDVLRWFGPMPVAPLRDNSGMLYEIATLLPSVWFHGDISQEDSEQRLFGKAPETFLVRFSSTAPGSYTVSRVSVDSSQFKHTRVDRGPNGFSMTFRPTPSSPPVSYQYPTLQALVSAQIDMVDRQNSLRIRFPCSGSKYATIVNPARGGYEWGGYEAMG
eukprot:TRINITY_DN2315_c1_g1_i1.p1 TRINITY_DN2315_c1_g1~~TRINITY_DN2315_c1_g1_i1.p1  ORF type:complete len:518 (-),score=111.11 TRINITY_DN2315_c1_g1_i1:524-2077(-)